MRLQKLIYQGIVWRGLYYASVFILNIVIARVFQAAESGMINYIINNLSFLLLVTSLSLESALGYFASRNEISLKKLTSIGLLFAIVSAVLTTSLFALFVFSRYGAVESAGELALTFTYSLGVVFTNYFSSLFYARHQPALPNGILLAINVAVIIFMWQYSEQATIPEGYQLRYSGLYSPILIVYFSSFLLQGIVIFITWSSANKAFPGIYLPSSYEMQSMLKYTFAALLANIIFFLVYRVDYWFVEFYCDEKALGNYIQVSKLGQIFLLLPSIIATAVFTKTAGGNQEQIRNVIEIISRWLLVFYIAFVGLILITGRWLFPQVYGSSFDMMYAPFMLLSPGILALSTLSLLTAFYAGRNKMGINIKGSVIALLVIVTGNFLFIPKYGIVAAAMVSSIGYICFQVYVLHQFRKEYRSDVLAFFIPKWSDWNKVKQFVRAEAN